MKPKRYTRLPRRQQRLVSLVLGGFLVLLLNSLLLIFLEKTTAALYMGMVLVHVGLGLLVIAPVATFIWAHVRVMPLRLNRPAVVAGLLTATSAGLLLGSGVVLVIWGSSVLDGWVLTVHLATVVLAIVGFAAHITLKKGVKYHFLEWGRLWSAGRRQFMRHPFSVVLFGGTVVMVLYLATAVTSSSYRALLPTEEMQAFSPGEAALAHEGLLDETDLLRSETCASCHADIYEQWEASAHHFSSFNNPYYAETIDLLVEERGIDAVQWCASCHDPAVLFTGGFEEVDQIEADHPTAQGGITCLSCHAVEGLRDVKGNGRYVIAEPDEYPFARSEDRVRQWMHSRLLRIKPEPHRQAMLKPMHQTAEFCGSCHKVGIPPEVNEYRWKRGQNQYDSWQASGVSGSTVRSFYVPSESRTCQSCHMPFVPSDDPAAGGGFIRSHDFAAANATLPALNGHGSQVEAVQETLADSVVTLDIARVDVNGEAYGPDDAMPVLEPGDEVMLSVVVRNRNVGHRFPAGTNDSNELWIELQARDELDEPALVSGQRDEAGLVDSTAHFFGSLLVDKSSQPVAKRDIHNWVSTVYANTIDPGTAQTAHYRFTVPADVHIHSLRASLFYRKFKEDYNQWVFRNESEVFEQPISMVHSTTRRSRQPVDGHRPLWERWNDYGIGLFLEENTHGALRAFKQVTELAPENPEGPINEARVYLEEGQLVEAEEALGVAEERRPGYLKTVYFRGALLREHGDYQDALKEWRRVAQAYPEDREVLRGIGRLYYLLGEYEESLEWMDRVLAIDPEDVGALYNRMLSLGALEREDDFEKARERYNYHRVDEAEVAVSSAYRRLDVEANQEAQSIHYHELHPVLEIDELLQARR